MTYIWVISAIAGYILVGMAVTYVSEIFAIPDDSRWQGDRMAIGIILWPALIAMAVYYLLLLLVKEIKQAYKFWRKA